MRSFSRRERLLVICYRLPGGGFNHGDHAEHREKKRGIFEKA